MQSYDNNTTGQNQLSPALRPTTSSSHPTLNHHDHQAVVKVVYPEDPEETDQSGQSFCTALTELQEHSTGYQASLKTVEDFEAMWASKGQGETPLPYHRGISHTGSGALKRNISQLESLYDDGSKRQREDEYPLQYTMDSEVRGPVSYRRVPENTSENSTYDHMPRQWDELNSSPGMKKYALQGTGDGYAHSQPTQQQIPSMTNHHELISREPFRRRLANHNKSPSEAQGRFLAQNDMFPTHGSLGHHVNGTRNPTSTTKADLLERFLSSQPHGDKDNPFQRPETAGSDESSMNLPVSHFEDSRRLDNGRHKQRLSAPSRPIMPPPTSNRVGLRDRSTAQPNKTAFKASSLGVSLFASSGLSKPTTHQPFQHETDSESGSGCAGPAGKKSFYGTDISDGASDLFVQKTEEHLRGQPSTATAYSQLPLTRMVETVDSMPAGSASSSVAPSIDSSDNIKPMGKASNPNKQRMRGGAENPSLDSRIPLSSSQRFNAHGGRPGHLTRASPVESEADRALRRTPQLSSASINDMQAPLVRSQARNRKRIKAASHVDGNGMQYRPQQSDSPAPQSNASYSHYNFDQFRPPAAVMTTAPTAPMMSATPAPMTMAAPVPQSEYSGPGLHDDIPESLNDYISVSERSFPSQPGSRLQLQQRNIRMVRQLESERVQRISSPSATDVNLQADIAAFDAEVQRKATYEANLRRSASMRRASIEARLENDGFFGDPIVRAPGIGTPHGFTNVQYGSLEADSTRQGTTMGMRQEARSASTCPQNAGQTKAPLSMDDVASFKPTELDRKIHHWFQMGLSTTEVHDLVSRTGSGYSKAYVKLRHDLMVAKLAALCDQSSHKELSEKSQSSGTMMPVAPQVLPQDSTQQPFLGLRQTRPTADIPIPTVESPYQPLTPAGPPTQCTSESFAEDKRKAQEQESEAALIRHQTEQEEKKKKKKRERVAEEEEKEKQRQQDRELARREQKTREMQEAADKAREEEEREKVVKAERDAIQKEKGEAHRQRLAEAAKSRQQKVVQATATGFTFSGGDANSPESQGPPRSQHKARPAGRAGSCGGKSDHDDTGTPSTHKAPQASWRTKAKARPSKTAAEIPLNKEGRLVVGAKTISNKVLQDWMKHIEKAPSGGEHDDVDEEDATPEEILQGDLSYHEYTVKRKVWSTDDEEPEDDEDGTTLICQRYHSKRQANAAATQELLHHSGDGICIDPSTSFQFSHTTNEHGLANLCASVPNGNIKVWVERGLRSVYKTKALPALEASDFLPKQVYIVRQETRVAAAGQAQAEVGAGAGAEAGDAARTEVEDVGCVYTTLDLANSAAAARLLDKTFSSTARRIDEVEAQKLQARIPLDIIVDDLREKKEPFCVEDENMEGQTIKVWVEERELRGARN